MNISDILAIVALIVAAAAAIFSWRAARAADRTAEAADSSNKIARESIAEAKISNLNTQDAFESEFKRVKGQAYWALYRAHNMLDRKNAFNPSIVELAAVQDTLSIYGHRLPTETREMLRIALNGIDLVVTFPGVKDPNPGSKYFTLLEDVRPHVRDAAMSIREEWMHEWDVSGETESS